VQDFSADQLISDQLISVQLISVQLISDQLISYQLNFKMRSKKKLNSQVTPGNFHSRSGKNQNSSICQLILINCRFEIFPM